jgi:hypothetical protein
MNDEFCFPLYWRTLVRQYRTRLSSQYMLEFPLCPTTAPSSLAGSTRAYCEPSRCSAAS